eukprot:Filipodium_phascolosomae@DN2174_c0_g1_i1.p1
MLTVEPIGQSTCTAACYGAVPGGIETVAGRSSFKTASRKTKREEKIDRRERNVGEKNGVGGKLSSSCWLPVERMNVLITGCDSGFGNSLACALAEKGATVYAGCLSERGVKSLKDPSRTNLLPIQMNVCSDEEVEAAICLVDSGGPLHVLVNNAGVSGKFLTDLHSLVDFETTVAVNYIGMVRVTKACLPLIKKCKGRIVNMTCVNGIVAGACDILSY